MSSQFVDLPLSGGGGGGGDVVGPAFSVTDSVVVFADTTGKLLADSAQTLTIKVPPGTPTTQSGNTLSGTLGLQFVGTGAVGPIAAGTGFFVETYAPSGNTALEVYVDSKQYIRFEESLALGPHLSFSNILVRPDSIYNVPFGRRGNAFSNAFFHQFLFGDLPGGIDTARALYIMSSSGSTGGTIQRCGIGFDNNNWNEWYLNAFDNTANAPFDIMSFSVDARTVTQSPSPISSASAGLSVVLKGGDNTSSGPAGDTVLGFATSASGVQGTIKIPTTSGAPAYTPTARVGYVSCGGFDPATGKLYIYDGSTWKSVTFT